MIKIILNDKRIFLTEDHKSFLETYALSNAYIFFELNESKVLELIDSLMVSEVEDAIVVGDIQANLQIFKSALTVIRAGGGVVFNNKDEILFIFRRKKWDLPKGKLDPDETIEACAKREVREETGIRNIHIERHICTTYHIYIEGDVILKESEWFLMYTEDKRLTPQKEEGIKKAIWVHKNNIRFQLVNTYPSIVEIFEELMEVAQSPS